VVAFYRNVLNWEIKRWAGPTEYYLVSTGDPQAPGIDGGIFKPHELFTGTVNTVDVANLEEVAELVRQNGGQVVTEKSVIPGVGYQVYCKDVEGTIFGLHQADPQAGLEPT
jgi:predicted enzyme related to lactoylglutathione lyase